MCDKLRRADSRCSVPVQELCPIAELSGGSHTLDDEPTRPDSSPLSTLLLLLLLLLLAVGRPGCRPRRVHVSLPKLRGVDSDLQYVVFGAIVPDGSASADLDRKSTRLTSSH